MKRAREGDEFAGSATQGPSGGARSGAGAMPPPPPAKAAPSAAAGGAGGLAGGGRGGADVPGGAMGSTASGGDGELSKAEIERLLAQADAVDVAPLTASTLNSALAGLEKRVKANLAARTKWPDQPARFMDSEVDLDEEIKTLHVLSTAPELYPRLAAAPAFDSLLAQLAHENTDIAISVVTLLEELTEEDNADGELEALAILVRSLLEKGALSSVVGTLQRLDESVEEEKEGVHSTMAVVEHCIDVGGSDVADAVSTRTELLAYLVRRVAQVSGEGGGVSPNALYASELLSMLLQTSEKARELVSQLKEKGQDTPLDGIDQLLQVAAPYRKKEPGTSEEKEFVSNVFGSICSVLMLKRNADSFRRAEGIELMLRCIKSKGFTRYLAIRALDFACSDNPECCARLIEAGGLKSIFPAFMGKGAKSTQKAHGADEVKEEEGHLVSLLANLLFVLPPTTLASRRTVAKFTEDGYVKLERLVELYLRYAEAVDAVGDGGQEARDEAEAMGISVEEAAYVQKLDAGLFSLQRCSCMLAALTASHFGGLEVKVPAKLREQGGDIADVCRVLREQAKQVGDAGAEQRAAAGAGAGAGGDAPAEPTGKGPQVPEEAQAAELRGKLLRLAAAVEPDSAK